MANIAETTLCEVISLGRCMGCDRVGRLDDGVCLDCLERRGRKWAQIAHRCRVDASYRAAVYFRIKSARTRQLFRMMFGDVT